LTQGRAQPGATGQRIQSLDRGLQILELIAESQQGTSLEELARMLEVEKSSACRLVNTLIERGYVVKDRACYFLHDKIFELAGQSASGKRIQTCARKYLLNLVQATGETAHLGVRAGNSREPPSGVVLVDHEFGKHALGVTSQWGDREPCHCTALGKALLAGRSEAELKSIMGPGSLKIYTDKTMTRIEQLFHQCRKVRSERLAVDDEEYRQGVRCLASPIFDFRGEIVAAIGISAPTVRMTDSQMEKTGLIVRDAGVEMSRELGYIET